jgi:lactoylglutathione lyase
MGYEVGGTAVELAHYWGRAANAGENAGFRHMAIGVPDLEVALEQVVAIGAPVTMAPTILVEGMPRIAFVQDPDGYAVELFQIRNRAMSR